MSDPCALITLLSMSSAAAALAIDDPLLWPIVVKPQ